MEEIFIDEYIDLLFLIGKRKNNHYKILLAIVQNPHTEEPEQLWKQFEEKDSLSPSNNDTLDKEGFERLKLMMADNPRIIIKS